MISVDLFTVVSIAACLQAKHFLADGPLQTKTMVADKGIYGARLGIVHSSLHAIGTGLVFAFFKFNVVLVVSLLILDGVIHYHVDYSKENVVKRAGWGTGDAPFWWALSADQMLHQLTYLGLVCLAFTI